MKSNLVAFFSGLVFAIGLGISGMTQPQKIMGFLDFLGEWDPSLAFVMIGAIGVHFFAYKIRQTLSAPLFSKEWFLPTDKSLPPSLFVGATLFGMGWGLGGYCPGPALVSLLSFSARPLLFVSSVLVGSFLFKAFDSKFPVKR